MGIEYYLVKPESKEIFYLGKHFSGFSGINNAIHKKEAAFPEYEHWMEFFWDTLQCNWDYFRDIDLTLPQISELIFKIFDWCYTDKVYFDNDCNDYNTEWRNWKETGSVIDIIEDMLKNKVSKPSNINKEEAAKILFDGDEVKAKILLELLESCSVHIGTFDELKMVLPTE